jgi:hypothetical protein
MRDRRPRISLRSIRATPLDQNSQGTSDDSCMAAGLTDKLMDTADVARLIDDAEMRATVQKRVATLALPQSN